MNMKRKRLFVVFALALALYSGLVLGQDLNVSITLENASQSRAAVADLALPTGQELRASPAPPEQEPRFQSADFARPNRLESVQIAPSDLPRGTTAVAVRCQGSIGADDGLGDYFCTADDNRAYQDVVQAVIDAVPTQRFVAARVDGQAVSVFMNFSVYVDCSSGSCLAIAARNHGYDIERLGLDYVDPQPIFEGDEWYVGFDNKLSWLRAWMPRIRNVTKRQQRPDQIPYVMAAEVDPDGTAGPTCLYWVARFSMSDPQYRFRAAPLFPLLTILDLERALASLGRVRYVPGMIDEAPATLRFFEQSVVKYQPTTGLYGVGHIDCN
jgi:hypothetical protein